MPHPAILIAGGVIVGVSLGLAINEFVIQPWKEHHHHHHTTSRDQWRRRASQTARQEKKEEEQAPPGGSSTAVESKPTGEGLRQRGGRDDVELDTIKATHDDLLTPDRPPSESEVLFSLGTSPARTLSPTAPSQSHPSPPPTARQTDFAEAFPAAPPSSTLSPMSEPFSALSGSPSSDDPFSDAFTPSRTVSEFGASGSPFQVVSPSLGVHSSGLGFPADSVTLVFPTAPSNASRPAPSSLLSSPAHSSTRHSLAGEPMGLRNDSQRSWTDVGPPSETGTRDEYVLDSDSESDEGSDPPVAVASSAGSSDDERAYASARLADSSSHDDVDGDLQRRTTASGRRSGAGLVAIS